MVKSLPQAILPCENPCASNIRILAMAKARLLDWKAGNATSLAH